MYMLTEEVSDHRYGIEVDDQGKIYLKSVKRLVTQTPPSLFLFYTKISLGVYITRNVTLVVKGQCQIT